MSTALPENSASGGDRGPPSHPYGCMLAMTQTDRRIAAIATGQLGAFTARRPMTQACPTASFVAGSRAASSIQTGPNAYRIAGAPTNLHTELNDLLLDIGEPVWCCAQTAAACTASTDSLSAGHSICCCPSEASCAGTRRSTVRSGSTSSIPREVDGLPVTSAVRTLLDLARVAQRAARNLPG